MKKFLVILMVVAMTSFLFVGCLPGVTPGVDDDEEDEDVGVKTDTPFITATGFDILATTTEYINDIDDVLVDGVGVAGAIIKLYIDDVYVGIGSTGVGGTFDNIAVTGGTVTEGAKTLYVTATLPGLAESDKSTEYTFTFDETAPTIASVAGDSTNGYITVTFSDPVDADSVLAAGWTYDIDNFYVDPAVAGSVVTTIVVVSSTTARLYEPVAGVAILNATDLFLSVTCDAPAITDLAGNEMVVPVTVFGLVTN